MKKTPKQLHRIVDKVLAYRPPPKLAKAAKKDEDLNAYKKAAD